MSIQNSSASWRVSQYMDCLLIQLRDEETSAEASALRVSDSSGVVSITTYIFRMISIELRHGNGSTSTSSAHMIRTIALNDLSQSPNQTK